ncbi:MHC class Ia alpha antigen [Pelobates cultripes]|uniref:MHC class Ia alpha antigen n=1 Tax=Pelobates cultripes TaxID=61616 RepID=A0AAD1SY63_PELCU|nr:MHC class Ia alpha antigen [Pelobates cultripes]
MPDPLLLLLIVGVSGVYCGHSLQYYFTGVSASGYGLPEFSAVAYVDGIQISNYSSDSGRAVPVALWMQKEGQLHWVGQTQIVKNLESDFKAGVKRVMQRFNQTGGYHSYQVMSGCELRDDGSIGGYEQHAYDGMDFLALDTKHWIFYPIAAQSVISTQRWNSPEVREGERAKKFLENECIEWLKRYIQHGKEELDRRVPPEVKVSDLKSYGVSKLHCHVYGFYPRAVDVNWERNGIEIPSDEAKQILPNTDGTYQIRATVEVQPVKGESYACHVDHSSLKEPLIVKWEPKTDNGNIGVIAGCVVGALIVLVVGVGIFLWKKTSSENKTNYALAADKDVSTASSTA